MDQADLLRRNSSLFFKKDGTKRCVEKRYHSRFNVRQEFDAYQRLAGFVKDIPGVRCASVLGVSDNTIVLEYVAGANLLQDILARGMAAVDEKRDLLLSVFLAVRDKNVFFDIGPSNIICQADNKGVVLIDPLCEPVLLSEHAVVVFLCGLIRDFVRSGRLFNIVSFCRSWHKYYSEYLKLSGVCFKELNRQLCEYIDVVIGWNRHKNTNEPMTLRLVRYFFIVPFFRFIKMFFRLNIVRMKQIDIRRKQ